MNTAEVQEQIASVRLLKKELTATQSEKQSLSQKHTEATNSFLRIKNKLDGHSSMDDRYKHEIANWQNELKESQHSCQLLSQRIDETDKKIKNLLSQIERLETPEVRSSTAIIDREKALEDARLQESYLAELNSRLKTAKNAIHGFNDTIQRTKNGLRKILDHAELSAANQAIHGDQLKVSELEQLVNNLNHEINSVKEKIVKSVKDADAFLLEIWRGRFDILVSAYRDKHGDEITTLFAVHKLAYPNQSYSINNLVTPELVAPAMIEAAQAQLQTALEIHATALANVA